MKYSNHQTRPFPLKVCLEFFEYLNQQKIRYCHWKSNGHLEQALAGETDLDLLVHFEDKNRFQQALLIFECKELVAVPRKRYPGITDWLGFDQDTGKLIHLHVHYQLIIGQKYVKNHFLPIEDLFFEHQRLLAGVLVPCAELELLLLLIRAHLKLDRPRIRIPSSVREIPYPPEIYLEFFWLLKDYQEQRFIEILRQSQLPLSESLLTTFVEKMRSDQLKLQDIARMRSYVIKSLAPFQRTKPWVNMSRYLLERLKRTKYLRKRFSEPRKTLAGGGKVFAVVGADGCGKSTLTRDLCNWFSWKLAVQHYYFGIPKTLIFKRLIPKGIRLLHRLEKSPLPDLCRWVLTSCAQTLSAMRWIMICKRRLYLFRQAQRFAVGGGVAITERYPLAAFHDMTQPMDGPRIRKESCGRVDSFALQEEAYYSFITLPSHVFVLKTDFDKLRERKGYDVELEQHRQKAEAVNALYPSSRISIIDGNQPYSEVLLQIKRKIWEIL